MFERERLRAVSSRTELVRAGVTAGTCESAYTHMHMHMMDYVHYVLGSSKMSVLFCRAGK